MEKVSVVITTYRREAAMVARAVQSVLAQTYGELEIVVVDDSPEGYAGRREVKAMISNMGGKVKYIAHKENLGACAARNTGIANSEGNYISFLDDDDEWLPQKLEKQMKLFADSKVGMVYCLYWMCEANQKRLYHGKKYAGYIYNELLIDNFIGSTSAVVLRRDVILQAGLFDTELESAQDIDMWIRCSRICDVAYVDEPLVHYYVHEGERITTSPEKKIQGMERVLEKYRSDIQKNPEALWKRKMKLAAMYSCNREYKKSFSFYWSALLRRPFEVHENLYFLKMIFVYIKSNNRNR